MKFRLIIFAATAVAFFLPADSGLSQTTVPARGLDSGELDLVPAALGIRTDSAGNSWNIENNGTLGRVGSSMINSGVSLLINDEQFFTYQPKMKKDGSEFVLHGRQLPSQPGLQVTRRIKLMEKEGAIRYLELLSNTTSNPAEVTISLKSSFSGNFKNYITNQGNAGVMTLGDHESGVLVTPGSTQSNRAFVFSLASPDSELKPTIASQNRYGLTFQYQVTIPPSEFVALSHVVAQVRSAGSFDRNGLEKIFRPLQLKAALQDLPVEVRDVVANFRPESAGNGGELLSASGIESLGVERGRRDVLALGGDTRLVGKVECVQLKLASEFGEALIPFEKVAAIAGLNGGLRDSTRIFLEDGQVFSGKVEAEGLQFVMASGGVMDLSLSSLDRIVRAATDNSGVWSPETNALIETYAGDRIAVKDADQLSLKGQTAWGSLKFSLKTLRWMGPREDEPVGHFISLNDGTRVYAFLEESTLNVSSDIFESAAVDAGIVRAIITRDFQENGEDVDIEAVSGDKSRITTNDGQQLVGTLAGDPFTFLTKAQPIEITHREIRRMRKSSQEKGGKASGFLVDLWDGGAITGMMKSPLIPLEVEGSTWKVPTAAIAEFRSPAPEIAEETRQAIADLLSELGAPDWKTREAATAKLIEFGHIAKSTLEKQRTSNPDPEVSRRIERVLNSIQ